MGLIFTGAVKKSAILTHALLLFLTLFFLLSLNPLYSAIDGGESHYSIEDDDYMFPYEPGMDFDKISLSPQGSLQSQFPSAAISIKANGTEGQVATLTLDGGPSSHTRIAFDSHVLDFSNIPVFDANLLPLDLVTDMEVYKHNFSPLGISASSGLINYHLANRLPQVLDLTLSAGSFGYFSGRMLLALPLAKLWNNTVGVSYSQASNDFNYTDDFNNTNTMQNMDYQKVSLIHKLNNKLWKFSTSFNWKEAGTGNKFSITARQKDMLLISGWDYRKKDLSFSGDYAYWYNHYLDTSLDDTHHSHNISLQLKKTLRHERYSLGIFLKTKTGIVQSTKLSRLWDEEIVLGLENTYTNKNLNLKIDIAQNYSLEQGYALIPAIGSNIKIHPLIHISLRISRVFQRPSFNDLYWPADSWSEGNPDLTPEQGIKYKGGLRFFLPPLSIQLSFSYSDLENLILWTDTSGVWKPFNQGKTSVYVANINLTYTTLLKSLMFKVNSSLSYNKSLNNDPVSLYYGNVILYTPEWKANLSLHLEKRKKWSSSLNIRYTSSRYVTEANTVSLPAYLMLDLRVHYLFFFININNILDYRVVEVQGYPQAGRNIKAGINIKI